MPFPQKVKEDALLGCGRCCCLCHKFCGPKIEVHHIRQESDGGSHELDNAIPLCFECHADMSSYDPAHPKGNKYSESELRRHRDRWFAKVECNPGPVAINAPAETDRHVCYRLLTVFPWNGSMAFLREHDCHRSFFPSDLHDLHTFEEECDKPGFEFVDPDLESLRGALLARVWEVTILTDMFTIETRDGGRLIPAAWSDGKPFFPGTVNKVDDAVSQLEETYRSLVRTATRKLGVLPPWLVDISSGTETVI